MNNIINQVCSVLMAFIVMVSTMSMTVNKHYCSNILVDTAVFQEAKTCGMHSDSSHKTDNQNEKEDEKPCCSSEYELIKGQDELQFQKIDFNFDQVFVATFVHTYFELFNYENSKSQSFIHYKSPPLVLRQLYKLDETYLI